MQTDFHEQVSSKYQLKRGTEKSTAEHTEIQEWYSQTREAFGSGNFEQFLARMRALENLVVSLKQSKKRWRKNAQDLSEDWFSKDVKNTKDQESLKRLVSEVKESKILPRGVKKKIVKSISDKLKEFNKPTIKRRGR